jgi:hypothetical protein
LSASIGVADLNTHVNAADCIGSTADERGQALACKNGTEEDLLGPHTYRELRINDAELTTSL